MVCRAYLALWMKEGSASYRVSVVRQNKMNMYEDHGEDIQDSGKTSTDVRGRDMDIEEGTGK